MMMHLSTPVTILLLSFLQRSNAIYSHYDNCSEFLIGDEKRSHQLCPTEIEAAEAEAAGAGPIIDVIPNFVDDTTLETIKASIEAAQAFRGQHQLTQRFISHVDVDSGLVAKMRGVAGFLPVADRTSLPTVTVEGKSSVPHIDSYMNELTNGMEEIMASSDRVGFLWVGDDDSDGTGQFRVGDITLPIKAGSFVHFRGDIPHYTVLPNGGSATMLGPFSMASPKLLGSSPGCDVCVDDDTCGKGDSCVFVEETRRVLRRKDDQDTYEHLSSTSMRKLSAKNKAKSGKAEGCCEPTR